MLILAGLSIAFAWAVFHNGGADATGWRTCMLLIGATALASWSLTPRANLAPPLRPGLKWPVAGLLAYMGLQLIPLPGALLAIVSPARAEIAGAYALLTGTQQESAPISVAPAASVEEMLRIIACIVTALLVREACWRLEDRAWLTALPLLLVGAAQAVIGLAQYYSGESSAHGSYVNRNHFAGLLEMALPFAVLYPAVVIRQSRTRWRAPARPALIASVAVAAALLLGIALLYSLSRMGFIAGLAGVLVAGLGLVWACQRHALRAPHPKQRIKAAAAILGILCISLVFFVLLSPDELIARFGQIRSVDVEGRPELWGETLLLVRNYSLFGCGLGGFESAFMRYKASAPMYTDDFAHNDYLQYLAEFGLAGFLLALAIAFGFVSDAARAAARHSSFDGACLAVACIAAFAAIGFHSVVDFNLYIPANTMLLAWIAGIASGAMFSSHPASSPEAVEILFAK